MGRLRATLIVIFCGCSAVAGATALNGFSIDDPLIPADQIMSGGPPKDGIPAIDHPRFLSPDDAEFLQPDDRVLGVIHNGYAKAYPLKILNRHEIVNDVFGGQAIVVSYCPLCGSGIVFSGELGDGSSDFGVSGLLYNSDVLLYDRRTGSLWSQIMMRAINGPMKGEYLQQIPAHNTSWEDWLARHPDTEVLSTDTGYPFIDYENDPYAGYKKTGRVWFPLSNTDRRLNSKEWVLGVRTEQSAKAYPFNALSRESLPLHDTIGTVPVRIEFDEKHQTAAAYDQDGVALVSVQLYWFAWAAFHPDTELFSSEEPAK